VSLLFAQPALAAPPAAGAVPPVIIVSGRAFDPLARDPVTGEGLPVVGATIEFFATHGDRPLAVTTSGANGIYTVTLATGGKPVDAYVRASKEGRVPSLIFPPDPLAADIAPCSPFHGTRGCILIAMLTPGAANFMAAKAGIVRDPARGETLLIASDCSVKGAPVAGATVAIAPRPERLVYTQGPFPAPGAQATDSSGRVFGFNSKPGPATIVTHYPDGGTGVAQVRIEAGAITIASTLPRNAHCAR
jgi:hypothetical protein